MQTEIKLANLVIQVIDDNAAALSKAMGMLRSTNADESWVSDFEKVQKENQIIKKFVHTEYLGASNSASGEMLKAAGET